MYCQKTDGSKISIHAPTQGATSSSMQEIRDSLISIHAPTQGATLTTAVTPFLGCVFQSTLPRRERPGQDDECNWLQAFQSTLPRRERHSSLHLPSKEKHFNPRSHAGSDGALITRVQPRIDFNPRSHAGSDRYEESSGGGLSISIHAPTQGATTQGYRASCPSSISIHAPTQGATWMAIVHLRLMYEFQSTLPRRERQSKLL